MASDQAFVDYVCDQIRGAGSISCRKMFGEYAIYCEGKVVALVCDNQLYVKPTVGGRSLAEPITEAPPYPGAKAHWLMGDALEDAVRMGQLIRITESELPAPKPKKAKQAKAAKSPQKP